MIQLKQLDFESTLSKFQIKDPDSEINKITKATIQQGLVKTIQSKIKYEGFQNFKTYNQLYKLKSKEDTIMVEENEKSVNFNTNNFNNQQQQQNSNETKLVANYGNKKIYSDLQTYPGQIVADKPKVITAQKRLFKIQKKVIKKIKRETEFDKKQTEQIRRGVYNYLFEQNREYIEKKNKQQQKIEEIEEEQFYIAQKKQVEQEDQNQRNKKLNRELTYILEGMKQKKEYDTRQEQQRKNELYKNIEKLKPPPKSMYISNINENNQFQYPNEINIIPISNVPIQKESVVYNKQIFQNGKCALDIQNIYMHNVIKVKNILWFLRQYMLHPMDFEKISSKLGSPPQKMKLLFDIINKSPKLDIRGKQKAMNKRKQGAYDYLKTEIVPEFRSHFKAILKPFFEQNQLYEPTFPQNEYYISFEQLRNYLHTWDEDIRYY